MICADVPPSVKVALPFAPARITAPPAVLTFTVPLVAVTLTDARLPSASATETPPTAREPLAVRAPGTVFSGARFVTEPLMSIGCDITPSEAQVVALAVPPVVPFKS